MTAPGANSRKRSANAGVPLAASAPLASKTSQPVSLLPFTPHDFPDDSSLKSKSSERDWESDEEGRLVPHGSKIISATRPIALALPVGEVSLAHMERSKSLIVQFMKGRGSRPLLAHSISQRKGGKMGNTAI